MHYNIARKKGKKVRVPNKPGPSVANQNTPRAPVRCAGQYIRVHLRKQNVSDMENPIEACSIMSEQNYSHTFAASEPTISTNTALAPNAKTKALQQTAPNRLKRISLFQPSLKPDALQLGT